ncbi:Clp protease N-terminal domain-containing protein [Orbaceae bacterium ac157xtp]
MLNEELQNSINNIMNEAQTLGYEYLTIEHLLLALIDDKHITDYLNEQKIDVNALYNELCAYMDDNTTLFPDDKDQKEAETLPTVSFQRIFERALIQNKLINKSEITGEDILLSILCESKCYAFHLLKKHGVDKEHLKEHLGSSDFDIVEDSREWVHIPEVIEDPISHF